MKRSIILAFGFLPLYAATAEDITYPDDSSTHLDTVNAVSDSFAPSATSPSNNTVRIATDAGNGITGNIYGGYEIIPDTGNPFELAESHHNTVEVLGGNTTVGGDIYGAYTNAQTRSFGVDGRSQSESAGNNVTILGGEMGSVYGAQASSALNVYGAGRIATSTSKSNNNTIAVSGGEIHGDVVGGTTFTNTYVNSANSTTETYNESNNNIVTISGGSIHGSVIGGDATAISGAANDAKAHVLAVNNTVNISGNPVFNPMWSSIYGGRSQILSATTILSNDTFSNNTLNFSAEPIQINNMGGFEYYNFVIPASAVNNTSLITTSGTADVDNAYVEVKGIAAGSPLNAGDSINLINAGVLNGSAKTVNSLVMQGVSLIYEVEVQQNGNQITATIVNLTDNSSDLGPGPAVVNPASKALSEGRAAGLAFLAHGTNLIADGGIRGARASINETEPGWTVFGIADGSTYRYDSGSHVDVDGFSMLAGAVFHKDNLMIGSFIEGGWGNYDTYNSFYNAASTHGQGNTSYYGAGILGRYDFDNKVYVDASFRTGRANIDFNSNDLVSAFGERANYDSQSTYYSAHAGVGYKWELQQTTYLDLSLQYLWTHLKSDSVTVAGDPIDFASSDSKRTRANVRLYHDVNLNLTVMAGLGYEYEFDGDIKAVTYTNYQMDTPSIGGGSGFGELGLRFTPASNDNLMIDAALRGYAGAREGINGTVQVNFAF